MSDKTITITVDDREYVVVSHDRYPMDVETEDVLYAADLAEGMMVLREANRDKVGPGWEHNNINALTNNRWCTVTDLRFDEDTMYFIGVYADGYKVVRQCGQMAGWYVKKDSIPERRPDSPVAGGTVEEQNDSDSLSVEFQDPPRVRTSYPSIYYGDAHETNVPFEIARKTKPMGVFENS